MPPDQTTSGGNLRAMIAGAIQDKIEEAAACQAAGQHPPTQPSQQEAPAQTPGQQPPALPALPQEPPKPTVSTEPVSQLDIASMFKTPTTEAPPPPAQLPPDTPVEAPPEIEHNERAKSAWEILRNRERESRHLAESLKTQLEQTSRQAGAVAEERDHLAGDGIGGAPVGKSDRLRNGDSRVAADAGVGT